MELVGFGLQDTMPDGADHQSGASQRDE